MKLHKIKDVSLNLEVHGQACDDNCTEKNIWVGKTNGNISGCVLYETAYTPRGTTWW